VAPPTCLPTRDDFEKPVSGRENCLSITAPPYPQNRAGV
jgi:hypothetical protein